MEFWAVQIREPRERGGGGDGVRVWRVPCGDCTLWEWFFISLCSLTYFQAGVIFFNGKNQWDWQNRNGERCNEEGSVTDESFSAVRWLYSLGGDFSYHFVNLHNSQQIVYQNNLCGAKSGRSKKGCRKIKCNETQKREVNQQSTGSWVKLPDNRLGNGWGVSSCSW